MSPDEYRRLVELEGRQTIAEEQRREMLDTLRRIEGNVSELLQAAAIGKGAWLAIVKLGAVVAAFAGGFAWAADHFGWWRH